MWGSKARWDGARQGSKRGIRIRHLRRTAKLGTENNNNNMAGEAGKEKKASWLRKAGKVQQRERGT